MQKRSLTDILATTAPSTPATLLASVFALPTRRYDTPRVTTVAPTDRRRERVTPATVAAALFPVSEELASSVFVPETVLASAPLHVSAVINAIAYSLPNTAAFAVEYQASTPVRYEPRSENYVHVPSWVTVSRAPFSQFGASLFGLSVPSTGAVYVREDLQGNEFTEVLFHEVLHTLYPSCSEQEIRSMVLARFGSDAPIHTHVCRPGSC